MAEPKILDGNQPKMEPGARAQAMSEGFTHRSIREDIKVGFVPDEALDEIDMIQSVAQEAVDEGRHTCEYALVEYDGGNWVKVQLELHLNQPDDVAPYMKGVLAGVLASRGVEIR